MSEANKAPIVKLAHGSRYHCFWVVQGCCIFSLHFSFPCFSYFFCGATSSYMFSITSFFVDQQKGCIFPRSPLTSWAQMSHLPEVRRDWQQNSELTQDLLLLQKVIYVEPANPKPHSECFLVLIMTRSHLKTTSLLKFTQTKANLEAYLKEYIPLSALPL